MRLRVLAAVLPVALAACGGGSSQSGAGATGAADLAAAAPALSQVELGITPLDVAPGTVVPPPSPVPTGDACDPHLLLRGEEVVERVNRHLYKVLVHVEDAIASDKAPATTGDTATWDRSRHGVDSELSVTRDGATTYSWKLLLKKTQDTTFTKVAFGDFNNANAAGPHQGKGGMTLDLTATAGVTGEEVAGTIASKFENFTDHRQVAVHAAGVIWDTDGRRFAARAPHDADYVSLRVPGKGGSLKVSETAPFGCPLAPNATQAQLQLVNRWYLPSGGGLHGRSDAALTGGILAQLKVAKVEALTCHQAAVASAMPAEGEWLLKAEDADGKTLWGRESVKGTTPCDPQLGSTVPTLADNKTDFDFSKIAFDDGIPYPFPQ